MVDHPPPSAGAVLCVCGYETLS